MKNGNARFRKKFGFAIAIFIVGSALAWETQASLESYTVFGSFLLAIFGAADLVDKKVTNKNGE